MTLFRGRVRVVSSERNLVPTQQIRIKSPAQGQGYPTKIKITSQLCRTWLTSTYSRMLEPYENPSKAHVSTGVLRWPQRQKITIDSLFDKIIMDVRSEVCYIQIATNLEAEHMLT